MKNSILLALGVALLSGCGGGVKQPLPQIRPLAGALVQSTNGSGGSIGETIAPKSGANAVAGSLVVDYEVGGQNYKQVITYVANLGVCTLTRKGSMLTSTTQICAILAAEKERIQASTFTYYRGYYGKDCALAVGHFTGETQVRKVIPIAFKVVHLNCW